jgi:hypothetical protein
METRIIYEDAEVKTVDMWLLMPIRTMPKYQLAELLQNLQQQEKKLQ